MARRTHDLRRALDGNANGTRMRNRAIVHVHVYYMHVRVRGAALRMCLVPPPGCRDYAAHIRLRLVLWRMGLLWRAVHVHGPYSYRCYNAAQRSMHICTGEVPLWDIEFRVQGAGCRCKAS